MLEPLDKRIVLIHCRGPWKDMHQIIGTQSQTLAEMDLKDLPAFIDEVEMAHGRLASVSMIRVTPRVVYYRENTPPGKGKLNEFHPSQV